MLHIKKTYEILGLFLLGLAALLFLFGFFSGSSFLSGNVSLYDSIAFNVLFYSVPLGALGIVFLILSFFHNYPGEPEAFKRRSLGAWLLVIAGVCILGIVFYDVGFDYSGVKWPFFVTSGALFLAAFIEFVRGDKF